MMFMKRILLPIVFILIYFSLKIHAKLRGLALERKTDVILYPKDYFSVTTGKKFNIKNTGYNVYGNEDNEPVILPKDYLYRIGFTSDTTKRRRKGMLNLLKQQQFKRLDILSSSESAAVETTTSLMAKPTRPRLRWQTQSPPSHTPHTSVRDYSWDVWPTITKSWNPTLPPSRSTRTLATYFPADLSKTRPWRLEEWSRGPTGPDEIYYNFYKDYYLADQVGKLNTYTGTPPKCHRMAYKVDGQVVNAPVHEELYEYAFLDYLKRRVVSYGTWSAYVKANPCFTTLTRFFGTTKIVALFAARPLMHEPNERNEVELYRKDYVVVTESMPTWGSTWKSLEEETIRTRRTTTTEVLDVLTQGDIEEFDEEEMFSRLREEDELRKKTRLLPVPTGTNNPYRNQWVGSLRTRLISLRPKTHRTNIVTPERWTSEVQDMTEPDWLRSATGNNKDSLRNVERFARPRRPKFDVRDDPPQLNFTICHFCSPDGDTTDISSVLKFYCHNLHEEPDKRYHPGQLEKSFVPGAKCIFNKYVDSFIATGPNSVTSNRYRQGCMHRFLDVPSRYDLRSCREWPPSGMKPPFVGKRFMRLEKMLRYTQDGCVSSPAASLTPFGRGISLWVRYHVCVCSGHYCNHGCRVEIQLVLIFLSLLINLYGHFLIFC